VHWVPTKGASRSRPSQAPWGPKTPESPGVARSATSHLPLHQLGGDPQADHVVARLLLRRVGDRLLPENQEHGLLAVAAHRRDGRGAHLADDYRHLDATGGRVGYLTGKFKDQTSPRWNTTIKPGASGRHACHRRGGLLAVTSVSGDGKQAVLLVLGQQTVTNTTQKQPRYDVVSLRVTAQLVHGKWLVADLATL